MKKKILPVVIGNVLAVSGVYASNNSSLDQLEAIEKEDAALDLDFKESSFLGTDINISGNVGASYEYEDKTTTKWNGEKKEEKTHTYGLASIYLDISELGLKGTYNYKHFTRQQEETNGYSEDVQGVKHLIFLDRPVTLGNGWGTGISYDLELETSETTSKSTNPNTPVVTDFEKGFTEQHFKPYLTYWNNYYNAGFYSHVEYLTIEFDNKSWGRIEEEGYSFLFKPYARYRSFQFETEFFYQEKNNDNYNGDGIHTGRDDFQEKYVEPSIRYSLENGGVLYVSSRFGKNETVKANGDKYYKDILKTKIGYEFDIQGDWLIKAEYEYIKEKETTNRTVDDIGGDEQVLESQKAYIHALYRF